MRISFPERVSPAGAMVFGIVSFAVQQYQHTDIVFSSLYFVFVMLSMVAFNTAGGFTRIAGAYYCWFSLLVCIIGVTWKMVIGEPGESNLEDPALLLLCYNAAALMFIGVAFLLKKVDLRRYEFAATRSKGNVNYTAAGLGCILVGIGNNVAGVIFGIAPGGLLSALRQLDQFIPLGIMLATIGAINDSQGRRTLNLVNILGMLMAFQLALTTFSKQGMFTPMVCWLIAVIYKRFNLRRGNLIAIALIAYVCIYILSPLSASRDLLTDNMSYSDRLLLGVDLMLHPQKIREHLKTLGETPPRHSYFSTKQNALIGRMNMMGVDDALVHFGAVAEPLGFKVVADDFYDLLPHFIAPNKPEPLVGNYYAHEIGGLVADSDTGTGISFSPVAESFRVQRWLGLFFTLPAVWLILFMSIEFICGDLKTSPWTLLPILATAHVAPEGLLSGQVYLIGYGNAAFFLCILISTRLAPVLGQLFYGSKIQRNITAMAANRAVPQPAPAAA